MKKTTQLLKFILLLVFICSSSIVQLQAQENILEKAKNYLTKRGELSFTFKANTLQEVRELSSIVSFDHGQDYNDPLTIKAIANNSEFKRFLEYGLHYTIDDVANSPKKRIMSNSTEYRKSIESTSAKMLAPLTFPLTAYPTYQDYADQMALFASNNPSICQLVDIGGTTEGDKRLLFIKLSDNVSTQEQEPRLMYTSSMHGDEIAGYPMMLDLIDYFITAYNDTGHSDHTRVKNLLDNSEVWINPSANPDGTYYNDPTNTSVSNARRANANGIDLNRNYPDNVAGPHANGHTSYELETQHFMTFADTYHFVISSNLHGGTELVNYPFDNAYATNAVSHPEDTGSGPYYIHPDTDWFEYISVEYATNAQNDSPSGYMVDDNDSYIYPSPGVTHGAEWYQVFGGRQDYMNFYHQCRETTLELSDVKTPPASELDDLWLYNKEALIEYLIQGTYGFRGVVRDANTNNPINATITIVGHDNYGSHTVTDMPHGDYYRPIKAGTYDIQFTADCYQSFTLKNQTIADYETKVLADVLLIPMTGSAPSNLTSSNVASTTATISWNAITGASFDYRYRVVGTSTWTDATTSNSSETLTGLTHSTQYEVQVRNTCNSNTSAYSNSIQFTTTTPPPCSGTIINTFPYSESFENNLGGWTQDTSDNFNWSFDSNSTPSTGTGPTGPSNGTYYIYTEANNGNDFQQAILNSPCFDLTTKQNASFSFDYHMYGSQIGSLSLEISIDDGANWTNIQTFNGQQQSSNSSAWLTHVEDLSAYDGNYIRLRIIGQLGNVTRQRRSDIAIDAISLTASNTCTKPADDVTNASICSGETYTWAANGQDYTTSQSGLTITNNGCTADQVLNLTVTPSTTYYLDNDGDGYGDPANSMEACSLPAGYVENAEDCNDNNKNRNPDTMWYIDNDNDGFGDNNSGKQSCVNPAQIGETYVLNNTDCDDANTNINPNSTDIPNNGIDEDCIGGDETSLSNHDFNLDNIFVSPNPFRSEINIKVPQGLINSDFNIKLFDINGRLIINKSKNLITDNRIIINDLDRLSVGAYIIKITQKDSGRYIRKQLIKIK